MSKVLVDRELLDSAATWLEVHAPGGGCVEGSVAEDLRAILEQPAEAEGLELPIVATLVIGEVFHGSNGPEAGDWDIECNPGVTDKLAEKHPGESFDLVRQSDHLAALSAVTAERDAANSRLHDVAVSCATAEQERDQLRAEVETWRAAARWSALRMSGMLASAQYSMTPETTHEVLELHHHVLAGTPEKIEWLAAMAAKEA